MTGEQRGNEPHRARRRFGQHFLHDRNVLERIVKAIAPEPTDHFVEIGPGQGALTRPLLERVARLDVIEIDRDLARALAASNDDPRLHVHAADALKFDFTALAAGGATLRVAGNLPYNVSTPLLFHLLEQSGSFRDLHVMLQKEVVVRMCASPGGRDYGRLTVALAARCRIERLFDIRPGAFRPPPKVDSSFIRLTPDPGRRATIDDEPVFDRVVAAAFSMRRKRIANALRRVCDVQTIERAGIDPDSRAERVPVEQFIRLANLCAGAAGA